MILLHFMPIFSSLFDSCKVIRDSFIHIALNKLEERIFLKKKEKDINTFLKYVEGFSQQGKKNKVIYIIFIYPIINQILLIV